MYVNDQFTNIFKDDFGLYQYMKTIYHDTFVIIMIPIIMIPIMMHMFYMLLTQILTFINSAAVNTYLMI